VAPITTLHRELGFIHDPDPADWTHLPLLRTSERGSYTRCREQWHNSSVLRITRSRTGNALRFGSMVHTALEEYYVPGIKRGPHPAGTFLREYDKAAQEAGYDFSIRDEDEEWVAARELGQAMLENYVDHWQERDKAWNVLAPEVPAMAVVLDKAGKPMVRYLMQFDAVIWDSELNRYLFVDHKTAASLLDPNEKELDDQCGTYWLFGPAYLAANGWIPEDADISGFLYNVLRKGLPDERPKNDKGQALNKPSKDDLLRAVAALGVPNPPKPTVAALTAALEAAGHDPAQYGQPSKRQSPPLFQRFTVYSGDDRRQNVLERIRMQAYEMNLVRKGKLGVYRVPMFGGLGACTMCEFYDLCQLKEDGADWEVLLDMDYEPRDPYAQYRELLPIDEDFNE